MITSTDLVGNEQARSRFRLILNVAKEAGSTLSLLLHGPDGVGKRTFAVAEAVRLAGHRSDVHVFPESPDDVGKDGYIKVKPVREMLGELENYPIAGDYKVLVLDGADQLNSTAADALLKVIEDRPEYLWVFLVAESISRVIPTIQSRAHPIYFGHLTATQMALALPRLEPEYLALAGGSPGRALAYKEGRAPCDPTWGSAVLRDLGKLSDFECMSVVDRMLEYANEKGVSPSITLRFFLDDLALALLGKWSDLDGWGHPLWAEVRRVMTRPGHVSLPFHTKTMLVRMRRILRAA